MVYLEVEASLTFVFGSTVTVVQYKKMKPLPLLPTCTIVITSLEHTESAKYVKLIGFRDDSWQAKTSSQLIYIDICKRIIFIQ